MLVVAATALLPVLTLAAWSAARSWYWPDLLPGEWSARAWIYLVSPGSGVREALVTGTAIALAVVCLAVPVAAPAARALAMIPFRGKRLALFLLLLPVLAPPLSSAMGLHTVFVRWGLSDSYAGVVLAHLIPAVPYCTLMLAGSFSRLNPELEAVARTLGATPASVLRHVTLPAIAPGLAVAAAFAFLISWSQYLLTLLMGGGRIQTLPLQLVAFQRSGDDAMAAAVGLVLLAPAVLVFVAVSRFLRDTE